SHLQVELTSILRDLPSSLAHLPVFGACLVQHGIRVIDVNIDFTWTAQSPQLAQAALGGRHGNVSHLLRGLPAALNPNQLVVTPECAVEQEYVGGLKFFHQLIVDL